jgi:hypothetical protein
VDAEEAQAVRAEGLDPDDPAVVVALDLVRWELSLLRVPGVASGGVDPEMSFDEIRALLQNPRKG